MVLLESFWPIVAAFELWLAKLQCQCLEIGAGMPTFLAILDFAVPPFLTSLIGVTFCPSLRRFHALFGGAIGKCGNYVESRTVIKQGGMCALSLILQERGEGVKHSPLFCERKSSSRDHCPMSPRLIELWRNSCGSDWHMGGTHFVKCMARQQYASNIPVETTRILHGTQELHIKQPRYNGGLL